MMKKTGAPEKVDATVHDDAENTEEEIEEEEDTEKK